MRPCVVLVNPSKSSHHYLPCVFVFGPAADVVVAVGKRKALPALSPGGAFSMLQQQAKTGRQARFCRCLRWAGWAGAGAREGGRPALPGPGCCSSVQQQRAEMPPTTARSPARAAAQRAAAAGRSAEGRSIQLPAAARSPCPPAAADLPGPVMRITGVMRGRERPAIAAQLRITEATLYAELGPGTGPLPVLFRTPWPLLAAAANPLRCRSAACEGSAASSREPVRQQPTGVMERGQRRGPLSECVPGLHGGRAAGATERKRPGCCRAAVVRGWGAGAASASGGAVGMRKG